MISPKITLGNEGQFIQMYHDLRVGFGFEHSALGFEVGAAPLVVLELSGDHTLNHIVLIGQGLVPTFPDR
jgi:hypothetical protein